MVIEMRQPEVKSSGLESGLDGWKKQGTPGGRVPPGSFSHADQL
jgi:hypothetical protein